MSLARLTFLILLSVVLALNTGCDSKPQPNPLEGWKMWGTDTNYHLDKAIMDDVAVYIETLSPQEKQLAKLPYSELLGEDGTGQHAVEIDTPHDGKSWKHVLIYDKNNKRIKVIRYWSGRYSC